MAVISQDHTPNIYIFRKTTFLMGVLEPFLMVKKKKISAVKKESHEGYTENKFAPLKKVENISR